MYTPAEKQLWSGRVDHETNPANFRFHQVVQLKNMDEWKEYNELQREFSLIGFASDEGVRRNKGRQGAAKAPDKIRSMLANLPYHMNNLGFIDIGNVNCINRDLEAAQVELGNYIAQLLKKHCAPVIVGGGHETLFGHYLGVREYIKEDAKLGIINIDAHFDLRDDDPPSSGTMFRQILEHDKQAGYLCIGIQPWGNTAALFQDAAQYGCTYILAENVTMDDKTYQVIDSFAKQYDYMMLTICMDVLASSSAPGVSAPSPFGLEPKTVRDLIRFITAKQNLLSFDISEVNPEFDENDKTVRLAAYLIAEVMQGISKQWL